MLKTTYSEAGSTVSEFAQEMARRMTALRSADYQIRYQTRGRDFALNLGGTTILSSQYLERGIGHFLFKGEMKYD